MRLALGSLALFVCSWGCVIDPVAPEADESDSSSSSGAGESSESEESGSDSSGGEPEGPEWPTLDCDPLVPEVCGFPFPNNVFTTDDPSTPTGRRLALSEDMLPITAAGVHADPAAFANADGFSRTGPILLFLPGASTTGLATPIDIAHSIEPSSPTIVIDTETGERVPHFVELDAWPTDSRRALMIRPAVPLRPSTRYIVAIAGVVNGAGDPIAAPEAFAALRDGTPTDDPAIEDRRALYTELFDVLTQAGLDTAQLQLAWDFTTASVESETSTLLHVVDDALTELGPGSPAYGLTTVQDDWTELVAKRIDGTLQVPAYVDGLGDGANFHLDEDGLPTAEGVLDIPFKLIIPASARVASSQLVVVGHGWLGTRSIIEEPEWQNFANRYNYTLLAIDWTGMSDQESDELLDICGSGRLDRLSSMVARLHQTAVTMILAGRMGRVGLPADATLALQGHPAVDGEVLFLGLGQGGLLGLPVVAVSDEFSRAVFEGAGAPYSLIFDRSTSFLNFATTQRNAYDDPRQAQLATALAQTLLDPVESAAYADLLKDPLDGASTTAILLQNAIGDHQVSSFSGHVMARSLDAVNLGPTNREIWGVPTREESTSSIALIEYAFEEDVAEPLDNLLVEGTSDPHVLMQTNQTVLRVRDSFFQTGVAANVCDGACDPE